MREPDCHTLSRVTQHCVTNRGRGGCDEYTPTMIWHACQRVTTCRPRYLASTRVGGCESEIKTTCGPPPHQNFAHPPAPLKNSGDENGSKT